LSYAELASRIRVPAGFVLGAIYLIFSQPTPARLFWGGAVALAGILLRAASAGFLRKNQSLATGGPYAHTRNPLYLGTALAGTGFCIAGGRLWFFLLLAAFLAAVYWPVLQKEEAHLRKIFPEYEAYARAVPAVIPRLLPWRGAGAPPNSFDVRQYLRNREYEALLAYAAILLALWAKMTWLAR